MNTKAFEWQDPKVNWPGEEYLGVSEPTIVYRVNNHADNLVQYLTTYPGFFAKNPQVKDIVVAWAFLPDLPENLQP